MKAPFFIIGSSRSGTTMLRLMLSAHPRLEVPSEAWFLGKIISTIPNNMPLGTQEIARIRTIILNDITWNEWNTSPRQLDVILDESIGEPLPEVVDRLFRKCRGGIPPGVRWGEKSPRHTYLAGRLSELFPEAHFIHMLRDGRDACASMLSRGWYEGCMRRIAEHWGSTVRAADDFSCRAKNRFLEIRFEDLLSNPRKELMTTSSFLGVDFDECMLDHVKIADKMLGPLSRQVHEKLFRPADPEECGKWRTQFSVWNEAIFLVVAGTIARKMGYGEGHRCQAKILRPPAQLFVSLQRLLAKARSKWAV